MPCHKSRNTSRCLTAYGSADPNAMSARMLSDIVFLYSGITCDVHDSPGFVAVAVCRDCWADVCADSWGSALSWTRRWSDSSFDSRRILVLTDVGLFAFRGRGRGGGQTDALSLCKVPLSTTQQCNNTTPKASSSKNNIKAPGPGPGLLRNITSPRAAGLQSKSVDQSNAHCLC